MLHSFLIIIQTKRNLFIKICMICFRLDEFIIICFFSQISYDINKNASNIALFQSNIKVRQTLFSHVCCTARLSNCAGDEHWQTIINILKWIFFKDWLTILIQVNLLGFLFCRGFFKIFFFFIVLGIWLNILFQKFSWI